MLGKISTVDVLISEDLIKEMALLTDEVGSSSSNSLDDQYATIARSDQKLGAGFH